MRATVRRPSAHRAAWLMGAALLLLAAKPSLALTARLEANRTSGVAPLAVFFDARGTSHSDGSVNEFHDLYYEFDFGDPDAGHWGQTSGNAFLARHSKNAYRGAPLAGHVYEEPGTYRAKVTVRDAANQSATAEITITVQDPNSVFSGSKTLCYANSGSDFSGCPSGAVRKTTSSFSEILGDAARGRRLLLRRGDRFSGTGSTADTGPGLVGAFGSGPKPRVTNSLAERDEVLAVGSDWRVIDLVSQVDNGGRHFTCVGTSVRSKFLLLRVEAHGGQRGFGCVEEGGRRNEDNAVVESIFQNQRSNESASYGWFYTASLRNMFMGNVIGGSATHNIRFPYARDFIFTFNYFNEAPVKANFRLHGEESNPTRWAVVGYNTHGPRAGGGAYNINTVSASFYNPIYDVIFEGNFIPHGQRYVNFGVVRVSARNNVMRVESGSQAAFRIWQRGQRSGPQFDVDDIWIYNNTLVWTSGSTAKMVVVEEQDGGVFRGDARFRDNLLYAPGASVDPFPTGSAFSASGNSVTTSSSQNPLRASTPGISIGDYEVVSTSVSAGATEEWFKGLEGSGGGQEPAPTLAAPFLH